MSPAIAPIDESAGRDKTDRVFDRRHEKLLRAGYGPEAAILLAASHGIDLQRAIELRARRARLEPSIAA